MVSRFCKKRIGEPGNLHFFVVAHGGDYPLEFAALVAVLLVDRAAHFVLRGSNRPGGD